MIEQHKDNGVCYLQFSDFLQFPEIIHGVFTRLGGYSTWGLNASFRNDTIDNILRNRLLVLETLGIEDYPCATVWQVHSADVATLESGSWDDWRTDWSHHSYFIGEQELIWTAKPRRKADAIITKERGVALALSFADCTPVLFYDPVVEAIGIAHAGWRGTARGIVLATVEAMQQQFGCQLENIYAGIAPAIGPCCYEVSEQVQGLFLGQVQFDDKPTLERYQPLVCESAVFSIEQVEGRESLRLDLWETNRNQLLMAGLSREHIELPQVCTSCNTDHFFSYRAEQGQTGRFPVVLALRRGSDMKTRRKQV
ncbi:MAG: peptidoglycan editing factor PgeF [Chloroflexota bacterium]|nr:peptidoglycan editing factor PgeF [Chloroflexota bacterium]